MSDDGLARSVQSRQAHAEILDATYLLPIRVGAPDEGDLTHYLRGVAAWIPVVIVDGSNDDVFDAHHAWWSSFARHVRPDPAFACANGKVHGVLTGLQLVTTAAVVVADDDVRYTYAALRSGLAALDGADLVVPQNYFDPMPWHAHWDTARTLCNRSFGHDLPGTFLVRTATLRATDGYDGDVLFENLELIRTVRAAGGRVVHRPDLYVRRLPPTTDHFLSQRVRQAYDELARPGRMIASLMILPLSAALIARRKFSRLRWAVACSIVIAERGRRVAGGRSVFPPTASLLAPVWMLERGACAWRAVLHRARGGMPYAGRRLTRAASSERAIARRLGGAVRVSGPIEPAPSRWWVDDPPPVDAKSHEQGMESSVHG